MQVDKAVKEKRWCFKVWSHLKKQKKQEAAKTKYADVDPKGPEIHRMAKQMRRQNQDICCEIPIRNNQDELCLDDSERMKAWV